LTTVDAAPAVGLLGTRISEEYERLIRDVAEVEILIDQSRAEASRQSARFDEALVRATSGTSDPSAADGWRLAVQQGRRLEAMSGQVEILESRRRTLQRTRELLDALAAAERASTEAAGHDTVEMEEVRRWIARAMHDGPAQSLTNIMLQAEVVERLVPQDSPARPELNALKAVVSDTLRTTKAFIFDVRPMILDDLGLVPTMRRYVETLSDRTGFRVDLEVIGAEARLPSATESNLFRLAGAAIDAMRRHGARTARLTFDWQPGEVRATLTAGRDADDGLSAELQRIASRARARAPLHGEAGVGIAAHQLRLVARVA
jgi:two-component system sensor histidine kinase DegS